MESSSVDAAAPSTTETKGTNSAVVPTRSAGPIIPCPNIPLPNIPIWARWVLGSLVVLAIPFYKRILKLENVVEKAAEKAAETIEKVAEVAEELAGDAAEFLPDGSLKTAAVALEHIAGIVDKGAEAVQAILDKVDDAKEELETAVEPIIEQEELREEEIQEKKEQEKQATNPSTDLPKAS